MTVPSEIEKAADIPVSEAKTNVAEKVDEHTPETPKIETPAPIPDPVDADSEGVKALEDTVKALAAQVDALASTVAQVAKPDEPPVKRVPWTKRGGRR